MRRGICSSAGRKPHDVLRSQQRGGNILVFSHAD
jgi:hypothetical protein